MFTAVICYEGGGTSVIGVGGIWGCSHPCSEADCSLISLTHVSAASGQVAGGVDFCHPQHAWPWDVGTGSRPPSADEDV